MLQPNCMLKSAFVPACSKHDSPFLQYKRDKCQFFKCPFVAVRTHVAEIINHHKSLQVIKSGKFQEG